MQSSKYMYSTLEQEQILYRPDTLCLKLDRMLMSCTLHDLKLDRMLMSLFSRIATWAGSVNGRATSPTHCTATLELLECLLSRARLRSILPLTSVWGLTETGNLCALLSLVKLRTCFDIVVLGFARKSSVICLSRATVLCDMFAADRLNFLFEEFWSSKRQIIL